MYSYPKNPNKEAVRWRLRCMCCKQRVTASDALKGHAYFALGGLWHAQHMNCARCRVNVAEIPFCESANEPNVLMCTDCYMAEYNPNCAACGGRLMETAMDAGSGKLYHKDCLRCKACKNPCADGRFMQDDAGAIYDVDCYHILVLGKRLGWTDDSRASASAEKTEAHA